jgi:hypothetical protein
MSRNMTIVVTSGPSATEVDEENAKDFAEAYGALKSLPVNRAVDVDFPPADYKPLTKRDGTVKATSEELAAADARDYVRQGKAWAATQTGPNGRALAFVRKGDVKSNPTRVTFRIYEVREAEEAPAPTPPAPTAPKASAKK